MILGSAHRWVGHLPVHESIEAMENNSRVEENRREKIC